MANITQNHQINDKISGPQSEKLLRWPEVKTRVGICRSHAHDLASKGLFPSPIKLSERCSAWVESDINAWIEERIAQGRTQNPKPSVGSTVE